MTPGTLMLSWWSVHFVIGNRKSSFLSDERITLPSTPLGFSSKAKTAPHATIPTLQPLAIPTTKSTMNLQPRDTYEKLEFDKVLILLEEKCNGEMSREMVREMKPSTGVREINRWLDEVAEFKQGTEEKNMFSIGAYDDISEELRMLQIEGYVLSESGLAKLNVLLLQAKGIFGYFKTDARKSKYEVLFGLVRKLHYEQELSNER